MNNPEKGTEKQIQKVGEAVRESYGKIARGEVSGCGCGCNSEALGYTQEELRNLPEGANLGLGCGNPRVLANFQPGETVLDLGSGAGIDCFNAARIVGDTGHIIGVDMTPEMLSKSRDNAYKSKASNVEFRLGEIENLPVADNEVDVIISNCVINLSPKKMRVYEEMFRTLKPGGRIAISDIVALKELPQELQADLEMIAACAGGAQQVNGIEAMLQKVGFEQIRVEPMRSVGQVIADWFPDRGLENYVTAASITASKPLQTCC